MSGVLGIFSFEEDVEVFPLMYYGLYALQHRGQAEVGIGTLTNDGQVEVHKFPGLVSDHFGKGLIGSMKGNKGLGFLKYKFRNESFDAMPLVKDDKLLLIDGSIDNEDFSTDECIDVLARGDVEEIKDYLLELQGVFVLLFMAKDKFVAYKNQDGIKPLSIGMYKNTIIAASESSAIESVGGTLTRELQPGELLVQEKTTTFSYYLNNQMQATENLDAFEYMYTARPDSVLDGISVYQARFRLGESLWMESRDTDGIVIGAPDSGMIAAIGFAHASGLDYQQGFLRNRYVGRTFIQLTQADRETSLQIKLTPIKHVVANRNIILIDDSIVRGSTIHRTVKSLREAGARQIHVRIASPPISHDESVTIDIPNKEELIAYGRTTDEMRDIIGCDSLHFLSVNGFHQAVGKNQMYEPYFKQDWED